MEEKKNTKLISSSMVDLKAELSRKQEEFKRQKEGNAGFSQGKRGGKATKGNIWSKQNSGVQARAQRDLDVKEEDQDEEETLAKSRRILEQKSKVYANIMSSSTIPEEDGSEYYLVDFQKKALDALVEEREAERLRKEDEAEREALGKDIPAASCPEEEWVDFVDSLGRDRRCMRKDLNELMEKDRLLALAQANKKKSGGKPSSDDGPKSQGPLPELMSSDMHREMMREKWEAEAQELLDKGQDEVHYSNVQFDEIRSHGVGFYQFSKDHEKREEELAKLNQIREETKDERSRKEKIKDKRNAMMEARLAKVRQRRGLKQEAAPEGKPAQVKQEDKMVTSDKSGTASNTKSSEEYKAAEEKRKKHIREWDEGKQTTTTWGVTNYVAARREERDNDFAPPSMYFDKQQKSARVKAPLSESVKLDKDRIEHLQQSISQSYQVLPRESSQPCHTSGPSLETKGNTFTDIADASKLADPSPVPLNSIPLPAVPAHHQEQEHNPAVDAHAPLLVNQHQVASSVLDHSHGQGGGNSFYHQQQHQSQENAAVSTSFSWNHASSNLVPNQERSMLQAYTLAQQWGQVVHHSPSSQTLPVPDQTNISSFQYPFVSGQPPLSQAQHPVVSNCTTSLPSAYPVSSHTTVISTPAVPISAPSANYIWESLPTQHSLSNPNRNCSEAVKEPPVKKSKIPKLSIVDTRYVNNFDPASINPEPGRAPDVAGVPYKAGTYSKYKPQGETKAESGIGQSQQPDSSSQASTSSSQITGGPLLYTAEQLARQQLELDQENDGRPDNESDPDADRKVQDFLDSVKATAL